MVVQEDEVMEDLNAYDKAALTRMQNGVQIAWHLARYCTLQGLPPVIFRIERNKFLKMSVITCSSLSFLHATMP